MTCLLGGLIASIATRELALVRLGRLAHLEELRIVHVSELLLQLREHDRVSWVLAYVRRGVSLHGSVEERLPLMTLEARRLC